MRKLILISCISLSSISFSSKAQTDPLYAQYLNNPVVLNPAYSGFTPSLNASVSYRKQWAGFEGSPTTINASAHSSLHDNKMGAGLIITNDKVGVNSNTDIFATYSYKVDLGKNILRFGLQGGMTQYKQDNSDLNVYDPDGGGEFWSNQNVVKPAFGAGLILSNDKYFLSFSVPRMLRHQVKLETAEVQVYQQHFYFTGAYAFFLSPRVRLKPSVLVKGVKGSPLSADCNLLLNIDEKYSAGVYTRNLNAYGLLAQLKLSSKYRFGYAFEVPTNKSVGARFVSHEVTLGLNLDLFDFHSTSDISSF